MSGTYKSYSRNMNYPSLYPNSNIPSQQYTAQLPQRSDCQYAGLQNNFYPLCETQAFHPPNYVFPETTETHGHTPSNSNSTLFRSQIPSYLLQPIYPWMKSKKNGKCGFGEYFHSDLVIPFLQ